MNDTELMKVLQAISSDLQAIKADNITIRNDLQSMKADVFKLPDIERNISLLMEGQQGMNEQLQKLDQLSEDMEEVKIKVSAVEEVTRSNSSQIRELRIAK